MTIAVKAGADSFEEFMPKVEDVLETVEWTGTQARFERVCSPPPSEHFSETPEEEVSMIERGAPSAA